MDETLNDVDTVVEPEALERGDELTDEEKAEIADSATPLDEVSEEEVA